MRRMVMLAVAGSLAVALGGCVGPYPGGYGYGDGGDDDMPSLLGGMGGMMGGFGGMPGYGFGGPVWGGGEGDGDDD